MRCTKCHGWKEREFHPVVYCKAKGDTGIRSKEKSDSIGSSEGAREKTDPPFINDRKKSQMLLKKMGTEFQNKSPLETIVQTYFNRTNPHKELHAPGAPFFKNVNADKTKSQSEKGDGCKGSPEEKIEQVQEKGSVHSTKSIAPKNQSHVKNVEYDPNDIDANDIDDTLIFKVFESGNERTCD
jgi:hypothetical protein